MIKGLEDKPYFERLKQCSLTLLELRRHRGDLIVTFKILTDRGGFNKSEPSTLYTKGRTRGHSPKLVTPRSRLNCRKFFIPSGLSTIKIKILILLPAETRKEAKSHGQSLQETIYRAQQSRQEARDHGQSRRKPNMTESLFRKRKLADSFIPCDKAG